MGLSATQQEVRQQIRSRFVRLVGTSNVLSEPDTQPFHRQDTIPLQREAPLVIQPRSNLDVAPILEVAKSFDVSVYPISTGNNWGYGGSLPSNEDTFILLDFSKMNHILEVNNTLGYVVIEPGVTQQQLADVLRSQGARLQMDPSGAGPRTSVLGNILERGYGAGVYGDHFLSLVGLEVILPNGKLIRTGFWRSKEAKSSAHAFKWGIGPYIEGLFTQSNFGVVTKAAVWLHPTPEAFEMCYFTFDTLDSFASAADEFRHLLMHGVLTSAVNVASRSRIASTRAQYPWDKTAGTTPLPTDLYTTGADAISEWTGCVALSGTSAQVKMQKKEIRRVLKKLVSSMYFVNKKKLSLFSRLAPSSFQPKIESAKRALRLLQGEPAELTLRTPYWRNRSTMPSSDLHPARDNCGLIWFAPVVPMVREDINKFVELVRPIVSAYQFDDCFGLLSVNSRALLCSFPLLYDRDDAREWQKAKDCYSELSRECKKLGYYSYRRSIHSMPHKNPSCQQEADYWAFIQQLKGAIDPDGSIAPGRYSD